MTATSARASELSRAAVRAAFAAQPPSGAEQPVPGVPPIKLGVVMSQLIRHGGLYTMVDGSLMEARLSTMIPAFMAIGGMTADGATRHAHTMATRAAAIPTYFFYHICDKPYKLHARLISYLTYPNLHLRSPVNPAHPLDLPIAPPGKTFDPGNQDSPDIPAAFTFVGQFIDHDLTLNAMNLFDPQSGGTVQSQASPFLDLDNVYGARVDDPPRSGMLREIPMKDGFFRLRKIQTNGYDVCREDKGPDAFGMHCSALIGDKRNDENQIILQIHILLMRLHNAFRGLGLPLKQAREQTILYWQSFVFHDYLPKICNPVVIGTIAAKLEARDELVHRPGRTICGGTTLGMPHEFAIGFRFGHSQLRSAYTLNAGHTYRLFDSLSNGKDDLQGGKCLDAGRLIDWPFFLHETGGQPDHPSNIIDTHVNQVVFDLPESTIPDDIKPVSNLPFRNLVRSDSVGLCAGEDVASTYAAVYGAAAVPTLKAEVVEPDPCYRALFQIDTPGGAFRTPLWYYLLREAEVPRMGGTQPSHLGPLGSHLVAEVILSAIWYAEVSLLNPSSPSGAKIRLDWELTSPADIHLAGIAEFVRNHDTSPHGCEEDACAGGGEGCAKDNPAICDGA